MAIYPLSGLIVDAKAFYKLVAAPAVARAVEKPDELDAVIGAFIQLYHVKDWAKGDGLLASENVYWDTCPYAKMTAEIANAGKHRGLTDSRFTTDPSVLGTRLAGWDHAKWDDDMWDVAPIYIEGPRLDGDAAAWIRADKVLTEVADWWRATLGL